MIELNTEIPPPNLENDEIIFAEESPALEEATIESWKILLVDDEEEIHHVTQLALDGLIFFRKKTNFS